MDVANADPSHDEVWDDSMLIDSWNQALEEYKKYHSIHVKGGGLRDLELESPNPSKTNGPEEAKQGSPDDSQQPHAMKRKDNVCANEPLPDTEQRLGLDGRFDGHQGRSEPDSSCQASSAANLEPQLGREASAIPAAFPPQAILGSVRDENLKKLLMSWYYAGYYTGLFEGQQREQRQQQS